MKGAPSIAVMLAGKKDGEEEGEGDLSLSETRARAEDAATAFASAVDGKDATKIVKAFCSLKTLCDHLEELEESGETDDEPKDEEVEVEEPDAADEG